MNWDKDNAWEQGWWGTCQNTYGEERKQLNYAKHMGLKCSTNWRGSPSFDMHNRCVLDVGGGPVSLLLKCENLRGGRIIDPCCYPDWVYERYLANGISVDRGCAEDMVENDNWDEVWLYNVLQHVKDPKLVLTNARKAGKVLRVFDWLWIPKSEGHPHVLDPSLFLDVLGPGGRVDDFSAEDWGAPGKAFCGVFK